MSTTTITKSVFFNASRESVWEYLTNKDKLGEWYYPAVQDLVDGEDYTLYRPEDKETKEALVTGRVLEMNAPSKLVTTFSIGPFDGNQTTITWLLEEAAGGTRLMLTHEGIAEASGDAAMNLLTSLESGWDRHIGALREAIKKAQ